MKNKLMNIFGKSKPTPQQAFEGLKILADVAKENYKVVSLVHLLSFVNDSDKKMYIDYLNVNSNHKIEYPKNISDLCL